MELAVLRDNLGYQGLLLGAAALLTSALLSLADRVTAPAIEAAEARDLTASLRQVLPEGFDNDPLSDRVTVPGADGEVTVWRARQGGLIEGVAFRVTGKGYAGPIVCLLGVDPDGRILGVRVLKHTETPGLGDKIEPAKDDWIHAFAGRFLGDPPAERWGVKKDGGAFDQFTGATITPRAVVEAVRDGLTLFAAQRSAMLSDGPKRDLAANERK